MALPLLKQQELFEPDQYLKNHSGRAFFSLLKANPGSRYKSQRSFPIDSMHAVLQALRSDYDGRDVWISQAEFYAPCRRLVCLSKIGLLFADLDTYKKDLHQSPEKQTELLLRHCEKVGLPEPSIVVFSGRGLQAKWLLDGPLPQRALPRWNALQDAINAKLQDFGADAKALDASRVLRLVQTVNSRSGELVRVMHYKSGTYSFDKLAKSLLPFGRELDPVCDQLGLGIDEGGSVILLHPDAGEVPRKTWRNHRETKNTVGLSQFFGFQLAWDRLADLRTLAKLRIQKDGQVPDGQRNLFVFLSAVFLCQAHVDQARIYNELRELASEFVPGWTNSHVLASASAALQRLKQHIAGQTVDFNGFSVTPRYRFKNETLVNERWLAINSDEEKLLRTIISETESKRRDAERARQKRADAGAITRAAYESNAEQKRATARLMRATGSSWTEVASAVGYKDANSARVACR